MPTFGLKPIALALALGLAAPACAAPALPRVVLAVDGVEQTRNLPVLIAERLGYFRDEGLTVTLVDSPAEPSPATLMVDGRADGAIAFYHHTFMTQTDNHLVTSAVLLMGSTPQLRLIVAARLADRVHAIADLKGLKIFTGGGNSGKTTAMNWLALRGGPGVTGYTALKPFKRDEIAAALASGTADAVIAHEPDAGFYIASGAGFMLADLESVAGTRRALGSIYPSTALYMPSDYIAGHPDNVQHLVNALMRAVNFIRAHSADEIAAAVPAHARGAHTDAYVKLVALDKQAFDATGDSDGAIPSEAAAAQLLAMAALNPKYRSVQISQTYTNGFVAHARPKAVGTAGAPATKGPTETESEQ